jgi:hypothetical protein
MFSKTLKDYHIKEQCKVEDLVDVFEQLLEKSSVGQKLRERARRKGLAEGELLSLREMLVGIVSVQHPTLQELAQKHARHIKQPDVLYELINMLLIGLNEKSIYAILSNPPTRLSEYT